ncbi:MAG: hypothetical protein CV087_16755 [Candidatus Brocadia sp. WS118]|nr:MAG: hypothetical protein CV087_16755 [Candidatus Brocadia sp. WS118]
MPNKSSESLYFSLAEFAHLLLIIAILGVVILTYAFNNKKNELLETENELTDVKNRLKIEQDKLKIKQDSLNLVKKKLAEFEDKKPRRRYCYEIDSLSVKYYVSTIIVIGANSFVVDGETLTYKGIRKKFRNEINFSEQHNCRLQVKVVNGIKQDYDSYLEGEALLNKIFYLWRE